MYYPLKTQKHKWEEKKLECIHKAFMCVFCSCLNEKLSHTKIVAGFPRSDGFQCKIFHKYSLPTLPSLTIFRLIVWTRFRFKNEFLLISNKQKNRFIWIDIWRDIFLYLNIYLNFFNIKVIIYLLYSQHFAMYIYSHDLYQYNCPNDARLSSIQVISYLLLLMHSFVKFKNYSQIKTVSYSNILYLYLILIYSKIHPFCLQHKQYYKVPNVENKYIISNKYFNIIIKTGFPLDLEKWEYTWKTWKYHGIWKI